MMKGTPPQRNYALTSSTPNFPAGRRRSCRPWRSDALSCSAKLVRVLGLTVAKRPVLFADFNQTNEHVLPAQAEALVQSVRDGSVKGRLLVDGSPGIERDLNEHAIFRPVDAKVVGSIDEPPRRMKIGRAS